MNKFEYEKLTPFKWYVLQNFPFIEADFDMITEYQLYCKVVEYLNNIIAKMNLTGEQMENVTNAMTELQNYVNNYFANLDVQEEINNKLDEMVEDGTLQDIINNIFTVINKRIDNIDTKVNNMTTATPQGAFSTLNELETAFPNGSTGIYVISSTNKWYFWNGTVWENGGNYNQSVIEFPLNVFTNFADFSRANLIGDNKNYGNDILIPSNFVNYIKVKTSTPGNDGKVFILFPDSSKLNMFVYREYDFISVDGVNIIPVNEYIPNDFYIMVKCTSISYYNSSGSSYLLTSNTITKNNSYNIGRYTNLILAIDCQLNLSYKLTNTIKQLKTVEIVNTRTIEYPIVFDFDENKLTFKGMITIYNQWNNQIGYRNINQEININALQNGYNNYYLIYNIISNSLNVIYQKDNTTINDEIDITKNFIVCSITVSITETNQPTVFYHSINSNMISVMLKKAKQENECLLMSNNKIVGNYYLNKVYKALGDSITRGEDPENSYKPMLNNRYTDIVAKSTGLISLNYGVGGSRITTSPNKDNSFWERRNVGDAYIYSIFGGTNDYSAGVEMGSINDNDYTHFKYAFYELLKYYLGAGKQVFVITPIRRLNDTKRNSKGYTLKDYVDAEKEICEMFGVPVLDLYNFYELNPNITKMKDLYLPDGLHPNKKGMNILGNRITSFIKNMLNYGSNQNIID